MGARAAVVDAASVELSVDLSVDAVSVDAPPGDAVAVASAPIPARVGVVGAVMVGGGASLPATISASWPS